MFIVSRARLARGQQGQHLHVFGSSSHVQLRRVGVVSATGTLRLLMMTTPLGLSTCTGLLPPFVLLECTPTPPLPGSPARRPAATPVTGTAAAAAAAAARSSCQLRRRATNHVIEIAAIDPSLPPACPILERQPLPCNTPWRSRSSARSARCVVWTRRVRVCPDRMRMRRRCPVAPPCMRSQSPILRDLALPSVLIPCPHPPAPILAVHASSALPSACSLCDPM
jgi:hypothetical protein